MKALFRQFGQPEGPLGWLAGHLMAVKNGERSRWALELLAPKSGERVLEIGFGPGVDVARLARAVGAEGFIGGVDPSREMLRQAMARNRSGVRAHRVDVRLGSAANLPFSDESFDAVMALNSAQFWPDLRGAMAETRRVLRLGGRAVIVVQPRHRGASHADSLAWGEKLRDAMNDVGFRSVETKEVHLAPVPPVAAIGIR